MAKLTSLERAFMTRWRQLANGAPEPKPKHRPFTDSNHHLDFAWTEHRVAVEMQGGTWVKGGHVRGAQYSRDCWKINKAQEQGWTVLQYTTDMLRDDPQSVIDQVLRCLGEEVQV